MKEINLISAIEALGETIGKQKDEIFFKDLQIKDLRESLAAAEKEIEKLKGGATE